MTLALQRWPGPLAMPASGLLLIGLYTAEGEDRTAARRQVRQALRAVLDAMPGKHELVDVAGRGLHVAGSAIGISVSHAPGLSVAAVHRHGAVGLDVMRVGPDPLADWETVARDYLGPAAMARIAASVGPDRARCFAQEWTRREAQLKLRAKGLVEWCDAQAYADDVCVTLALPEGYAGSLITSR